jgi:glycosyltransferase involved in cell wall biosynthesis
LDEVYGIQSSTFHNEADYPLDANYTSFPVVKTHLLPEQLKPHDSSIPAVYLVRDGRDCVVSLAHYRRMLIAEETDFEANLIEAIDAAGGSHFGGWSEHVRRWLPRASVVLKFEDLIADPIGSIERLRPWLDLPQPRVDRLPSFRDLRSSDFRYGSGVSHGFQQTEREKWRTAKFRRGQSGAWKNEMPEPLQLRFLHRHGTELAKLGYPCPSDSTAENATSTPTLCTVRTPPQRRNVLIDAVKMLEPRMDGIRRYVQELLIGLLPLAETQRDRWNIDVSFGVGGTFPLLSIREYLENGQPPPESCPKELPLTASRDRLRELRGQISAEYCREALRYSGLKLHRSLQKRWLTCRELAAASVGRLGWLRERSPYDLVHVTLPNTWSLYHDTSIPRIVTVHDLCHLVCPEFQNASNVRTLDRGLRAAEQTRAGYLAVSHSTAAQMVQLLGTDTERIRVVQEGCGTGRFQPGVRPEVWERVQRRYNLPDGPYFLSVGTVEPRKNLLAVVRAFHLLLERHPDLDTHLLIAGAPGWGDADELRKLVSTPRIHMLGYVDDDDLPVLYGRATAFCYASHYEGFGLPLLEAMNCGTPTIYGDNSSMPEIARGAGLPAASRDVQAIARGLEMLSFDAPLRKRLSETAVLRAREFTWEKTAAATLDSYEEFIATGRFRSHSPDWGTASFSASSRVAKEGGPRVAA